MASTPPISDAEGLRPELVERINRPTVEAAGLPNDAYVSPAFLALERERIFSATWTCIGHACTVPAPGDAHPVELLGLPLLMVRDAEGGVRVFHNVCSHRGNQLAREPCHFQGRIRCPYHAWTYRLDGTLLGTPHIGGPGRHENDTLERSRHGLKAVRAAFWLDLVFVNVSGDAPPFERHIAPLAERIRGMAGPAQLERMRPAATHGRFQLEFDGNWKLVIENNLESYHLPFVHPDLNRRSRLEDHYHYYGGDLFAGQGSNRYEPSAGVAAAGFERFEGWAEQVAEYPTLFPNVLLGAHCDHIWSIALFPLSPGRTREEWQIHYVGETASDPVVDRMGLSRSAAEGAVDAVFETIVESVARGEAVRIVGFGTFATRSRSARAGRNPQTGERIAIPASKAPSFKTGKAAEGGGQRRAGGEGRQAGRVTTTRGPGAYAGRCGRGTAVSQWFRLAAASIAAGTCMGTAGAGDLHVRAGAGLDCPAGTAFPDLVCSSASPAALDLAATWAKRRSRGLRFSLRCAF